LVRWSSADRTDITIAGHAPVICINRVHSIKELK
jgi:hypothetical protein